MPVTPRSRLTAILLLALAAPALWAQSPPPAAAPVAPAVTPAPVADLVEGPLGQKLDLYMSRLAGFGFSGAVLVSRDGRVVLQKGYGWADRENKVPFTAATVFDIGSITKQFTAAAILRLEMAGKLKVDDPITRFFADVPTDKAGITLHHLLTHSSGLPDGFGDDYDALSREALVKAALDAKLLWPPGTRYRYSNAGYSLLAAVIEKVSGRSYEEFLRNELFRPAGMERTGYRLPGWGAHEVAHGYLSTASLRGPMGDWGTPLDKAWASDGPWWNLRGNGGILSTVVDLARWHGALAGEAILSPAEKEKYVKPWVPEDEAKSSFYGYGWAIARTPRGTRLIAHNGGNGIFSADFRRYVDEGVVVIGAANQASFKSFAVTPRLASLVFGQEVPLPPPVVAVEPAALARFEGAYKLPAGGSFSVRAGTDADGRAALAIAADGASAFTLLSGGVADPAQWSERQERLRQAMLGAQAGDYAPLHQIFGTHEPLAQVAARAKENWRRLQEAHGPLAGIDALGTAPQGGQPTTYLRLRFARGEVIAAFGWEGPEVTTVQLLDELPGSLFLPLSSTEVAALDPPAGTVTRVGFETAADGAPKALVVHAAGGDVRAVRATE